MITFCIICAPGHERIRKCQSQSQNENTTAKSKTQQITIHNRMQETRPQNKNTTTNRKHKRKKKKTQPQKQKTQPQIENITAKRKKAKLWTFWLWIQPFCCCVSSNCRCVLFCFVLFCFFFYGCVFHIGACVLWFFVVFYFLQLCFYFVIVIGTSGPPLPTAMKRFRTCTLKCKNGALLRVWHLRHIYNFFAFIWTRLKLMLAKFQCVLIQSDDAHARYTDVNMLLKCFF